MKIKLVCIIQIQTTFVRHQTFAHLQERNTEICYSIWYSVLLLW